MTVTWTPYWLLNHKCLSLKGLFYTTVIWPPYWTLLGQKTIRPERPMLPKHTYQAIKCQILPFCHTNDVSPKAFTVDFVCHCCHLIKYVTVGWRKLGKQLVLTLEMAIGEQRTTHPQQEKTCIVFVPNLMESPLKGGSVAADVLLVRLKRCQMGPCDLWAKLALWAWWVRWAKSAWWVKWGW